MMGFAICMNLIFAEFVRFKKQILIMRLIRYERVVPAETASIPISILPINSAENVILNAVPMSSDIKVSRIRPIDSRAVLITLSSGNRSIDGESSISADDPLAEAYVGNSKSSISNG